MSQGPSYEQILRTSERVNWHLAEVVASLEFDFNRPFLPERIAATNSLSALSAEERLQLNQIRGHGYAHLFLFVEEFIVPLTAQVSMAHTHTDPIAMRAMLRFCEEELKHQELFVAVKAKLQKGFRSPLRGIEGRVEIADAVMQRSQLAVMLLTSMLEWITQRHYLECFRARATPSDQRLDAGFSEVFRLHWVEEAQHAKLDTLELRRMAADATPGECERAVDEMLELCEAFDGLLGKQAHLELDDLEVARGRRMGAEERSSTHATLHAAYRWAFFVAGMDHPIFQQIVAEVAPQAGPTKLERGIRRYSGSA